MSILYCEWLSPIVDGRIAALSFVEDTGCGARDGRCARHGTLAPLLKLVISTLRYHGAQQFRAARGLLDSIVGLTPAKNECTLARWTLDTAGRAALRHVCTRRYSTVLRYIPYGTNLPSLTVVLYSTCYQRAKPGESAANQCCGHQVLRVFRGAQDDAGHAPFCVPAMRWPHPRQDCNL